MSKWKELQTELGTSDFFVATQGTIFNWANIVSNSLSSCISAALGGVSQNNSEFYMSSFRIYCILCTQPFPAFKCQWDKTKTPNPLQIYRLY